MVSADVCVEQAARCEDPRSISQSIETRLNEPNADRKEPHEKYWSGIVKKVTGACRSAKIRFLAEKPSMYNSAKVAAKCSMNTNPGNAPPDAIICGKK